MTLNYLVTLPLTPMELLMVNLLVLPQLIFEINALLSVVFGYSLMGLSLLTVYERMIVILFHASTATLIGYGLVKGETLKYYLLAVALHILPNSFAILYILGVKGTIGFESIITAISLTLFVYLLYKKVLAVKAS